MEGVPQPWWRVSVAEALRLQREWAQRVCRELQLPYPPQTVAGVDAAYGRGMVWGTAIVLELPSLRVRDIAIAARKEEFPYIPGLLSFREAPAILQALESLSTAPDILLCDGQGIAHPRRLGIASHLGVLTGLPSIGCAKSLLCGRLEGELAAHVGSTAPVWDRGEIIAMALRTRANVKPVYVSIGHRVDMAFAVEFVLHCCRGYRLPEPVRLADAVSRKAARGESVEHLLLKTRTAS